IDPTAQGRSRLPAGWPSWMLPPSTRDGEGGRRHTRCRGPRTRADKSGAPAGRAWATWTEPRELRRIHGRQLNHRDVHIALVVEQLAAQRFVEALDGVFGTARRPFARTGGLLWTARLRRHDCSSASRASCWAAMRGTVNVHCPRLTRGWHLAN